MKKYFFASLLISGTHLAGYSQSNYWDVPLTEELISHNKRNYADHQEARNNQLVSTATVSSWRRAKDDFKGLVDKIDKRLTQAFIVAADITTLYNSITALKEIVNCQEESFGLLYKHPFAAEMFYQKEIDLVKNATELYGFVYLIVVSYGDISKMQVSDRETVFREMSALLYVLRAKAFSLLQKLKQIDFAELYKQTQIYQFINKDGQLVRDILNNFKH